ncbi:MAG TPA: hypothetical protein VHM88_06500 [Candidatus Acidoferrales bacterium]|nr:hypothetical protein [Candidatus Acidoferrales bacterium]
MSTPVAVELLLDGLKLPAIAQRGKVAVDQDYLEVPGGLALVEKGARDYNCPVAVLMFFRRMP